ncbi:MAG TPA: hypothetical protein VJ768_05300, partial [Anaerolineales bacterium]|nr:hypothetical protein [Anaerolineales bacterium]
MQSNKVLFGVILILSISSVLALGFLAWTLSDLSRVGNGSAAIEAALASARDLENASDPSSVPLPLELSPEPFRGIPTSLAEFRMIPATLTPEPLPTKIYGEPALVLGESTWTDAFESLPSSADPGPLCASVEADQGRLRATASGNSGEFCIYLIQKDSPDFYLKVDLEPLGPCSSGEFGLFFRGTEDGRGSYLGQTCDGRSRLIFR